MRHEKGKLGKAAAARFVHWRLGSFRLQSLRRTRKRGKTCKCASTLPTDGIRRTVHPDLGRVHSPEVVVGFRFDGFSRAFGAYPSAHDDQAAGGLPLEAQPGPRA